MGSLRRAPPIGIVGRWRRRREVAGAATAGSSPVSVEIVRRDRSPRGSPPGPARRRILVLGVVGRRRPSSSPRPRPGRRRPARPRRLVAVLRRSGRRVDHRVLRHRGLLVGPVLTVGRLLGIARRSAPAGVAAAGPVATAGAAPARGCRGRGAGAATPGLARHGGRLGHRRLGHRLGDHPRRAAGSRCARARGRPIRAGASRLAPARSRGPRARPVRDRREPGIGPDLLNDLHTARSSEP